MPRGIAMPRGINNATCHTQELNTWHFLFLFQKNLKKFKKNLKKIFKKFLKNKKNQRLTRGTLTNDVSQLCLKGT